MITRISPLPLKSPLIPPIFFTICANLVYCVRSSWTSLVDTPDPRATLWILPGCLLKTLAPSVLSSSADKDQIISFTKDYHLLSQWSSSLPLSYTSSPKNGNILENRNEAKWSTWVSWVLTEGSCMLGKHPTNPQIWGEGGYVCAHMHVWACVDVHICTNEYSLNLSVWQRASQWP